MGIGFVVLLLFNIRKSGLTVAAQVIPLTPFVANRLNFLYFNSMCSG